MWPFVTIDQIPQIFRYLFFSMLTVILGSVTYKVVDNFFLGGPPAHWNGSQVGFSNYSHPVGAAYSHLNHKSDWLTCVGNAQRLLKANNDFKVYPTDGTFVAAHSGDDLIVIACNSNSLDFFVASNDYPRAQILRSKLAKSLKMDFGKWPVGSE